MPFAQYMGLKAQDHLETRRSKPVLDLVNMKLYSVHQAEHTIRVRIERLTAISSGISLCHIWSRLRFVSTYIFLRVCILDLGSHPHTFSPLLHIKIILAATAHLLRAHLPLELRHFN